MRAARWNEKTIASGAVQIENLMTSIVRRAFSEVDDHIEYLSLNAGHQLVMIVWRGLKMKATQNIVFRNRVILFCETCRDSML